ncbi:hypothetical protein AWB74_08777 [Caballeronia arvi]|uniref:Uncharacterized protein n=1 Tax=Caballeronia arvi TaxID=1777135 RepID=A0A158L687_9BURK|nr:hypothetical protein AWB74_08777 [Caballeronia arvi]
MGNFASARAERPRVVLYGTLPSDSRRLSSNRSFGGPALIAAVAYELHCNVTVRKPNH